MGFKSSVALRLAVWFLLLSIFPLAVVAIFVIDDVSAGFTELTLDHRRSQAELLAASLGRLSPTETASFLQEMSHGQYKAIFIVDPNGKYQLHSDENKIAASMSSDFAERVVAKLLSGEAGAVIEAGTERVIGFSPIPNQADILVTIADKSRTTAMMSAIRRTSQLQLAVSLVIMAIAGGLAIWLVVGSPVRRLTRAAEQVSQGNFDVTVDPEDTVDELQMLALAFNQMTGQLRDLISGLELKVAELEEAEQAIRSSEEYFRALIENAQDIITVLDADGTIRFESPAVESVSGYKPEELVGQNVFDYVHPEDRGNVLERFHQSLQEAGSVQRAELRFKHRDGTWRYLEAIGQNLLHNPMVRGGVVNSRDITERKRLEEQFHQSQKMEAIGTLAGGIAHDFNNILASIMGYTELAILDVETNTEIHEYLQGVMVAGNRAKDLVRQILAFSRQTEKDLRPLRLEFVLTEVFKLLRASLPATIEIQHQVNSKSLVLADATQIHQLIMNLCANAAYAMEQNGGTLTVALNDVQLETELAQRTSNVAPGSYVRLTVSDTGHGIPPEIMDRIFDPFFTTKEKGKGTGIGLSAVHGIVKSHRGEITVSSEPGKGCAFNVFLPRIEKAPIENDAVEDTKSAGDETILFVDDEQAIVKIGIEMLTRLGYQVNACTGSTEALELFNRQPEKFDLVICDMTMPQMTGEELAGKLRDIRPDIPIILCTGYSTKISELSAKNMGIDAFLLKPLTMSQIGSVIRKVLDQTDGS